MKTSNVILLSALGIVFFTALLFQFSVRSHVRSLASADRPGELAKEERAVTSFRKILVKKGVTVYVKPDTVSALTVEAPENLLNRFYAGVQNDTLVLEKLEGLKSRDSVTAFVSVKELEGISIASGAYLKSMDTLRGERIELEFKTESDGWLALSYAKVHCKADSDSRVKLVGDLGEFVYGNQ